MRLPETAHTSRPWRIHELTPDFRLEDVWRLPTPGARDDFPLLVHGLAAGDPAQGSSRAARILWAMPVEARRAARLGQRRRGPRVKGADSSRPLAGRSARRTVRPGVRGAPLHLALPARGRVGGRDRQPDHARGHARRLGLRRNGGYQGQMAVLVKPNGLSGNTLHGRDQAVPPPGRLPGRDQADRAYLAGGQSLRRSRTPLRAIAERRAAAECNSACSPVRMYAPTP